MIIKQVSNKLDFKKILSRLALMLFGLLLIWLMYYIYNIQTGSEKSIKTSFENKKGQSFYDKGYSFSNSNFQTNTLAKTGKNAILLTSDSSNHAAYIEINNPGDLYVQLSVWVKINKGKVEPIINVNSKKEKLFNRSFSGFEKGEDWSKMEYWFYAPNKKEVETLVFDLEVKGKGEIYFDDFEIKFTEAFPSHLIAEFESKKVNLRIGEKGMAKLKRIRDKAIGQAILISSDDDWVDAKLEDGDEILKAKVRLKGDWVDHLKGHKWSYRIKFKKDHTWKRLRTVSFQTPAARNLLSEWVLHELWQREDVLTTRYDFFLLDVNGISRGVYAYEEHFEKQLLEYKNRREGPIVKFGEDAMWDVRLKALGEFGYIPQGIEKDFSQLDNVEIQAFVKKKTLASPTLAKHFEEATHLMHQYQKGAKSAADIFDLDQIAKYYAICDLMNAYHATIWHNQRFYYNPVVSKLEPIGYDGNVGGINYYVNFLGQSYFRNPEEEERTDMFANLSSDLSFVDKYVHYLNKFTKEAYVQEFIKSIEKEAKKREQFLKVEFAAAKFKPKEIETRAKRIQMALNPHNEHSLAAFEQEIRGGKKVIKVKSKHHVPLVIKGTGISSKQINVELGSQIIIWNNKGKVVPHYEEIEVPLDAKFVFFQPVGMNTLMYSTIKKHKIPSINNTSAQEIFANISLDTSGIYEVVGDRIFFKAKSQATINKNMIIPAAYTVVFEEGVELDFINGAAFISRSPVEMYGTEENPIKINSSDKSAKGFTIIQASQKSILKNVLFNQFDTWKYKNWSLTGAVTFYESDVDIDACIITENSCEDALNIVRAEFQIENITISNTFGDGFDADFCKGKIQDSRFLNTGNDGMDFSGSVITIDNCIVDGSGDKGLSAGEESHLIVEKLQIKNAVLGLAAKDLSTVIVKNIDLENCQQGFAAFRKKPEYGGGSIDVINYTFKNVTILHQVEKGSRIKLKDKLIKG